MARYLSIREVIADMSNHQTAEDAGDHITSVISWCSRSRLEPFVKPDRTLRRHRDGILGYFKNHATHEFRIVSLVYVYGYSAI